MSPMPRTRSARIRVIVDNDFSGDPDDLFQLAHHALSPSVEIPFVIGSHLSPGDPFDPSPTQADNAARVARDLLELLGADTPVMAGSNLALKSASTPQETDAAHAIVAEAMRDDTDLPLVIALGAGMTELASALLIEPGIADRMTAVWIGGPEHEGVGLAFPNAGQVEYNLAIDIPAAQHVFNDSSIPLHQIPRNAYRQCLISLTELDARVRPHGALGERLAGSVDALQRLAASAGLNFGETYCLGDQPLVLATALTSAFEPDTSSSEHVVVPTPRMTDAGWYEARPDGRALRVYSRIDTRLLFEDMFLKFASFAS